MPLQLRWKISVPFWNACRPCSSCQVIAPLGMSPLLNQSASVASPLVASGVATFGLPSSPTITPPAPCTASSKLTVRPSYLLYWPAKHSSLSLFSPCLILSQACFISSNEVGG